MPKKCGAGAPARENCAPLHSPCGTGIPARNKHTVYDFEVAQCLWVAQRFSAAVTRAFLSAALAAEGALHG